MGEDEGLEALLRQYLRELEGAFPRWWDYWVAVKTDPEDFRTLERFYREIHRLKGSAGSYGLPELSRRAADLEERLEAILKGRVLITKPVWEKVSALLSKLELGFLAAVRQHKPEAQEALRRLAEAAHKPIRVLCVDDDPAWLRLLRHHLEELGFEVRTLSDPTQALPLLEEFRPRFLVLDLDMPELDGRELCRRVRRDRSFDELIVVILTARDDVGIRDECLRIGANEFCSKLLGPVGVATRLQLYTNPVRYYLAASLSDN